MVEIEFIIAFSMALANVFKKQMDQNNRFQDIVPFIAVLCCVLLNSINAFIFKGDIAIAGKDAFVQGIIVVGIFSGGNAVGSALKGGNSLL